MIPQFDLSRQHHALALDLEAALARVLRSGRFVLGAEGEALEDEVARFCGVRHAVGVASGSDAL
jgi:dTDP-4-amino-4,6-dideoxygalactose transaminase